MDTKSRTSAFAAFGWAAIRHRSIRMGTAELCGHQQLEWSRSISMGSTWWNLECFHFERDYWSIRVGAAELCGDQQLEWFRAVAVGATWWNLACFHFQGDYWSIRMGAAALRGHQQL